MSTIHSWCNRMLREHAFDSDSLFTQRLETDQADLLAEVVRDYWRSSMYPLDADAARRVRGWWSSPEALQGQIEGLLTTRTCSPRADPTVVVGAARQAQQRTLATLKAPWGQWVRRSQALLDSARATGRVQRHQAQEEQLRQLAAAPRRLARRPGQVSPDLTRRRLDAAHPGGAGRGLEARLPRRSTPRWPPSRRCPPPSRRSPTPASTSCATPPNGSPPASPTSRRAAPQMGFNDLLTRLDARPTPAPTARAPRRGDPRRVPGGADRRVPGHRRASSTASSTPSTGSRPNDPATALVLIGDPRSRPSTPSAGPTSTPTSPPAPPPPAGCTPWAATTARPTRWCRPPTAASSSPKSRRAAPVPSCSATRRLNPVPFFPADANGRKDQLQADGQPLAALHIWRLPPPDDGKPMSKGAYLEAMAEVCASEMARLLNLGQRGAAGFADAAGLRPLRQADLAVLVNNRSEADAIRGALASRGVRSVYLSERTPSSSAPRPSSCSCGSPPAPSPTTAARCAPRWPPRPSASTGPASTASTTTSSPGRPRAAVPRLPRPAGAARACCRCCAGCSTTSACRPACWPPAPAASAASPTCCTWPSCSSRPAACSTANTP